MAASTQPIENQIKKRNDAYTGFLAISFLAMAGGAILMWLEYQNYENKPLPKPPVIDVPGVQGKAVPGSGVAPKVEPPKPPDEPAKEMMMKPKPEELTPVLLPPVEAKDATPLAQGERTQPAVPVDQREVKIFEIPDAPGVSKVIQAVASESVQPALPQPEGAVREPELTDAPPIQVKRFSPPMQ